MNRKRWFITLAVVLPLALFGAAKWATRWRPIAVGRVEGVYAINGVSNRYLSVYNGKTGSGLFDLKTGAQTNMNALSGLADDWIWSIETRAAPLDVDEGRHIRDLPYPSPQQKRRYK